MSGSKVLDTTGNIDAWDIQLPKTTPFSAVISSLKKRYRAETSLVYLLNLNRTMEMVQRRKKKK